MLQLKDLPDNKILKKFAERYVEADIDAVMHYLTILRIGTEISEALDGFLAKHGLLQGRWWVLILLMREDDLTSTPSVLAKKAGVSKATMSGLISGLKRDGLVLRADGANDGRSYSITLSDAGQAKLDAVMPDYYARVNRMMHAIPLHDREEMLESMLRLEAQVNVFK